MLACSSITVYLTSTTFCFMGYGCRLLWEKKKIMLGSWNPEPEHRICNSVWLEINQLNKLLSLIFSIAVASMIMHSFRILWSSDPRTQWKCTVHFKGLCKQFVVSLHVQYGLSPGFVSTETLRWSPMDLEHLLVLQNKFCLYLHSIDLK